MAQLAKRDRVLLLVGSIGPLGHFPASGTVTVAAIGLPLFWLSKDWPGWVLAMLAPFVSLAAVWVHQVGDRILKEKDSRKLVWDEIAGYLVAVSFLPFTWRIALVAFAIERVFDICKIPPARSIERSWPGGWGVVGDDIVAGLYTCAIMHVLIRLFPELVGL